MQNNAQKDGHGQADSGGDRVLHPSAAGTHSLQIPGKRAAPRSFRGPGSGLPHRRKTRGSKTTAAPFSQPPPPLGTGSLQHAVGAVFWLKRTPLDLRPGRCTPQGPSAQSNREGGPDPVLRGSGRTRNAEPSAPNRRSPGQTGRDLSASSPSSDRLQTRLKQLLNLVTSSYGPVTNEPCGGDQWG